MSPIEKRLAEISHRHRDCTDDTTCAAADDDLITLLLLLELIEHRAPEHVPSHVRTLLEGLNEKPFDSPVVHAAIRSLIAMCGQVPAAVLTYKQNGGMPRRRDARARPRTT